MNFEKNADPSKPVFSDKRGRRRHYVNYLSVFAAVIVTILLSVFVISVLVNPFLPQIRLKPVAALPQQIPNFKPSPFTATKEEILVNQIGSKAKAEKKKRDDARSERAGAAELLRAEKASPIVRESNDGNPLAVGFFVNFDDSSMASLKQNINSLDWVVPEWIRLSGNENDPLILDIKDEALQFIQQNKPG